MGRLLSALAAGLIFGFGLGLSQMVDPDKVLGFLDVAGAWEPSLAFVMIGAIAVGLFAFRFIPKKSKPMFAESFSLPTTKDIDARLVAGAVFFGVGWGLVGFCPGPAISSIAYGHYESLIFIAAMVVGFGLTHLVPVAPTKSIASAP